MNEIKYILAEIGQCAGIIGCEKAPKLLAEKTTAIGDKVAKTVTAENQARQLDALPHLVQFSGELANAVRDVRTNGLFPIVIGGDHSCGIGTWSGVIEQGEDFGLLWIDAHFDLHTPNSTDSGNLHGTPVATLLGYGDDSIINTSYTGAKVKPENVAFIGIRCFETPEQQLAEKLGVKIFYADEVSEKGFKNCFETVIKTFQDKNISFGISFDMDSLDVSEMTALGTPVENGLILNDVMDAFNTVNLDGLRAVEVVEYNPTLDKTGDDIIPVQKVISCFDKDVKI